MHCIYFKTEEDPRKALQKPWNCEPSVCTPSKWCPHRVDTKKLKELFAHALDPELQRQTLMKRSRAGGCVRPFDKYDHIRTVTSSSQPDG